MERAGNLYTCCGVSHLVRVRELFPVTAWVWRQLASRWACRIYLSMLAVIVIPAVALRLQAALFQRHVVEIASRRSTLQIGTTSKSETLSRIPGLTGISSKDGESKCLSAQRMSVFPLTYQTRSSRIGPYFARPRQIIQSSFHFCTSGASDTGALML